MTDCIVAPYTGAWIETMYQNFAVAPYTGAWIETGTPEGLAALPTRGRGLKLIDFLQMTQLRA